MYVQLNPLIALSSLTRIYTDKLIRRGVVGIAKKMRHGWYKYKVLSFHALLQFWRDDQDRLKW